MAKVYKNSAKNENKNNRITQIFDDLEDYLKFCKDYGYRYDESELYSQRSYVYRQYTKYLAGKPIKDNWSNKNNNTVVKTGK